MSESYLLYLKKNPDNLIQWRIKNNKNLQEICENGGGAKCTKNNN